MQNQKKKMPIEGEGGLRETIVAFVICSCLLILPMIYIEYEYKLFTQTHGKALEGAASGALALAVVFRTVSRTVLRTIIRTSARAGMRASLKGALRAGIRAASRAHSKKLLGNKDKEAELAERSRVEQRKANLKSLVFASALLFFSWVIVIGFGQPFGRLMDEKSTQLYQEMDEQREKEREERVKEKAYVSYQKGYELREETKLLRKYEKELKMERDTKKQSRLEALIKTQKGVVGHAKSEYAEALEASNKKELDPNEVKPVIPVDKELSDFFQWLYTYAPFPGEPKIGQRITLIIKGAHDVSGQAAKDIKLNYQIGDSKLTPFERKTYPPEQSLDIPQLVSVNPAEGTWSWVQLRDGIELEFDKSIDNYESIEIEGSGFVETGNPEFKAKKIVVPLYGRTSWSSPSIWVGGVLMVIPLWVMFLVQMMVARQANVTLRHETGPVGGVIQLYFAGAFSFMPLTSDVIVADASPKVRSRIALLGILVPALISIALWYMWKVTESRWVLFTADAFLIYPMVQCFPLAPLEGIHLFRHSKLTWVVIFGFVMGLFMFIASEGLRNVI